MEIKFTDFDERFLDKSFKWLNDEEIKKLTMSPDLTKEEQRSWFDNLSKREDYCIWGVLYENIPIGAVGIKKIDMQMQTAEYFGYIGEKEFWGQGIGKKMMEYVIMKSTQRMIKTLYLNVSKDNCRAISLYQKCGFVLCDSGTSDLLHMTMCIDKLRSNNE